MADPELERSVEVPSQIDRRGHLDALHSSWATPLRVVTEAVVDATTRQVVAIDRIVGGEQNEAYDVTLDDESSVIVRISHRGVESHEREVWVLGQCAARGIRAPRVHAVRLVPVAGEQRSIMVMEKLAGEPLRDADIDGVGLRRILGDLGAWLAELHSIPVSGCGYLDGAGVGWLATLDDWLGHMQDAAGAMEAAGRSVGLDASTIRGWLREVVDAFHSAPPRVALVHNDLLPEHVLVHGGQLSGVVDFGEVAAEAAASDFAKWDFTEGAQFPVELIQAGYGDRSLFDPPNDRTLRALWFATGLWRMRWYHGTRFQPGVQAARDQLLHGPNQQPA